MYRCVYTCTVVAMLQVFPAVCSCDVCASCSDTVSQQFCATTIERCNPPPPPSLSLSLSAGAISNYFNFEAVLYFLLMYYCLFIRERNFQISHNIIIAEIVQHNYVTCSASKVRVVHVHALSEIYHSLSVVCCVLGGLCCEVSTVP